MATDCKTRYQLFYFPDILPAREVNISMAMYFVQHGIAVPKDKDPNRPLTPEGRKEIESISSHLQNMGLKVNQVCHSGKVRAKETAKILSAQICDGTTREIPGMTPFDDVIEFTVSLEEDTMYVGHLPHLEKLISYLVTDDEEANIIKYANGGVASLKHNTTHYYLDWFLKPSICKLD
jgi:phosphohistidine phosphatase